MAFKDHFSSTAAGYATFRPVYPAGLFNWLASLAPARELAWDCATGSGQAALALAGHFRHVHATDASSAQLDHAQADPKISYACEPAEQSSLADGSADLITVAQALHWFDQPRFFAEARRVLKPGGVLAVWCYQEFDAAPAEKAVLSRFYHDIVGPWWPPERRLVEQGYGGLVWPFDDIAVPPLEMCSNWSLPQLLGYLRTWSATRRYLEATGIDPVTLIEADLLAVWGDPRTEKPVTWPLQLRAGRA